MNDTTESKLKYEQALEELEAIIERIESGEVGLEESLEQYERGMKLIQHCQRVLHRAEQTIEKLSMDAANFSDESGDDAETVEDAPF